MAKFQERLRARELRRRGHTVSHIAHTLGVSKGSVSVGCRDLELTKAQQKRIHDTAVRGGHKGRMIGATMNRQKKERMIVYEREVAQRMVGSLSKRDLLMIGLGLYWGEGVKASGTRVSIVNSDPHVIVLMQRWFVECMGVSPDRFRPVIFINAIHKPRARKLLQYWSDLLQIPQSSFAKTVFLQRPQKKVYENYESYYGIMALQVAKPAELKYRIMGMLGCLATSKQCRGSSVG